jgi:transcription elongation factor SPT5
LSKNGQYWVWNGEHFKDGFLEKDMRITTFSTENVNPTLEEIGKFAGSENSGEIGNIAHPAQLLT